MIPAPPADAPIVARLLDAEAAAALGERWDELLAEALEENAFLARAYVLAGLGPIDDAAAFRALAVFRGDTLIGLWPLRRTLFRYGLPLPVGRSFLNAYQTNGTPLVHRRDAVAAIDALLAAVARGPLARRALLEQVRRDGPVATLIRERAAALGLAVGFVPALERPVLRPDEGDADGYFRRHLAPKRLRDLQRTHRRLGELGRLHYARVTEPEALAGAVEAYARLEAAGWKGRAGTAYDASPEGAAYLRASFGGTAGGRPIAYADLLTLNGHAIAVNLNLLAGRTVFALKTTYDEAYRRHSPGLVLEYCVIRDLFETRFADEIDSCVTEDGHVLQSLWSGTAEIGTLTLQPLPGLMPDLARTERRRHAARRAAKRLYLAARERLAEARVKGADAAAGLAALVRAPVPERRIPIERLSIYVTLLTAAAFFL